MRNHAQITFFAKPQVRKSRTHFHSKPITRKSREITRNTKTQVRKSRYKSRQITPDHAAGNHETHHLSRVGG